LEARAISGALADTGQEVTLALKGLTRRPVVPRGVTLRSGGFGGVAGLATYLQDNQTQVLIDATHPFAATMSWNAFAAAAQSGTRLMTVQRPPWSPRPGDRWQRLGSLAKAARRLRHLPPKTVLLALGGQGAETFRSCRQHRFQARVLESSKTALATSSAHRWRGLSLIRVGTAPTLGEEMAGLQDLRADLMIVRNAGGSLNAKLLAARRLRLPVWIIDRPPMPPAPTYGSPTALLDALTHGKGAP